MKILKRILNWIGIGRFSGNLDSTPERIADDSETILNSEIEIAIKEKFSTLEDRLSMPARVSYSLSAQVAFARDCLKKRQSLAYFDEQVKFHQNRKNRLG